MYFEEKYCFLNCGLTFPYIFHILAVYTNLQNLLEAHLSESKTPVVFRVHKRWALKPSKAVD